MPEAFPAAVPSHIFRGAPLGQLPSRSSPAVGPLGGPQGSGEMGEALQELLQDMNMKFSSLSSSILGKLDDMALKLDGLERQLGALLAEEQQEGLLAETPPAENL